MPCQAIVNRVRVRIRSYAEGAARPAPDVAAGDAGLVKVALQRQRIGS